MSNKDTENNDVNIFGTLLKEAEKLFLQHKAVTKKFIYHTTVYVEYNLS